MITKVELENWKSHHETTLEFSEGVNALIGTMGSGKSSVLEAITFGLYGTTPSMNSREITLDDAIRRTPSEASDASVKVWLEIEGEEYTVERVIERGSGTRKSELRKEGELLEAPSTQEVTEQVEKILGMDFKSFTRAIYAEQNNLDLFLEMRPGNRKERIDELLKLDRFEDARQTTVKAENRLEDELEQKQEELGDLEDEFDGEELEELEEEIEDMEEKLEKLKENIEELKERKDELEEELEELKQKEEKQENIKEKITRLKTRKKTVEERLDEKEGLAEIENIDEKLEEKRESLEKLEEKEDKISKLEQKIEMKDNKMEEIGEEIEELEEEVEKFEDIEEIEGELEEVAEKVESVKEKGNRLYAERQNLVESVKTLKDTDGECPTCGQEMDEKHREELFSERKEKINDIKKKEKNLREELDEITERKEELEEKRDELMQYQKSAERLEKKQEKLEELEEETKERKETLEELQQEYSGEKVEELEDRIEKLNGASELEELEEKKQVLEEKIEDAEKEMEELEFDEEGLEELRERLSGTKQKISVKKNTQESREELLEEKNKRLEQMHKQREKLKELEEEVENVDEMLDFIHTYKVALEDTQVTLRRRFVEKLNQLMEKIWDQVYPYDDYYSIRLNAEEGYLLELLDSENNWISAEAEVSGGERHSAALVMRLALTFALSPKLQLLILDEPTHNLDSSAVEELAETLRERASGLINQLFIVTHDPSLEAAATGKLYQFEKKGTETGLTEVEEVR